MSDKEKKSGAVGRIYHLQVVEKYESDLRKLEAERDAYKEFKQGVYQYLREYQPSTKEEIELYESFSNFIRGLDN